MLPGPGGSGFVSTATALVRESGLSWEPFGRDTSGVDVGALVAVARRHKPPGEGV